MITGGVLPYTDKWLRCFHWALFEYRVDRKRRFIVTNTHWGLTPSKRMENSKLMQKYVAKLKKKYNVPIISTGDFNSSVGSPELSGFISAAGMKDVMENAPDAIGRNMSSWIMIKYFNAPFKKVKHIDHILYPSEMKIHSAKLLFYSPLMRISDHLPLVADLSFAAAPRKSRESGK